MIHLFIEITKLPVKQIALIVLIPAVTNLIYMARENYNNYEYTKKFDIYRIIYRREKNPPFQF